MNKWENLGPAYEAYRRTARAAPSPGSPAFVASLCLFVGVSMLWSGALDDPQVPVRVPVAAPDRTMTALNTQVEWTPVAGAPEIKDALPAQATEAPRVPVVVPSPEGDTKQVARKPSLPRSNRAAKGSFEKKLLRSERPAPQTIWATPTPKGPGPEVFPSPRERENLKEKKKEVPPGPATEVIPWLDPNAEVVGDPRCPGVTRPEMGNAEQFPSWYRGGRPAGHYEWRWVPARWKRVYQRIDGYGPRGFFTSNQCVWVREEGHWTWVWVSEKRRQKRGRGLPL